MSVRENFRCSVKEIIGQGCFVAFTDVNYFQCWHLLPNKTVPATESPLIWTVFINLISESL